MRNIIVSLLLFFSGQAFGEGYFFELEIRNPTQNEVLITFGEYLTETPPYQFRYMDTVRIQPFQTLSFPVEFSDIPPQGRKGTLAFELIGETSWSGASFMVYPGDEKVTMELYERWREFRLDDYLYIHANQIAN